MFRPAPTPRISLFYRYKFGAFLTLLLLTNQKVNFIYQPFFKNSSPFFHIAKFRYILPKVSLDKPKSKFYLPFLEKLFSLLPTRSLLFTANDLCASCTISKPFFLHCPPSCLYCVLTVCSFFPSFFGIKTSRQGNAIFPHNQPFPRLSTPQHEKNVKVNRFFVIAVLYLPPTVNGVERDIFPARSMSHRAARKQIVLGVPNSTFCSDRRKKKNAARNGRRSHKYVQDDLIDTSKNR